MALPSSPNQISMGDINVELGRTRTTANTSLAGGNTPVSTSLFGLATSSVNKTAPHAISEFHGYSHSGVYSGSFTYSASSDPCPNGGSLVTIYWGSSGDPYTNNATIYSNSSLTTNAPAGYYWSPITSYVNLWLGTSWASYNSGCFP